MIKNHLIIRTKFKLRRSLVTAFKDIVAQQTHNKKWDELSTIQQDDLRSKHRQQFDILSRRVREEMLNNKRPGEKLLEYNRKFIMDKQQSCATTKLAGCKATSPKACRNEQSYETGRSDHDLLIRVDERTERIEKWCFNHDVHHFRYNLLAWSIAAGAIVTLAIALIKVL